MHAEVQRYYGEVLRTTGDLKTTACCTTESPPEFLQAALARIHDDVVTRYYGCGLVLPEALEGMQVLDLGCGAGRDVYVLSQLVGAAGRVTGIDMTPPQLEVARRHRRYHAERFGHPESNVDFIEGNIESLDRVGLANDQFDVIVSNCVINLATDKQAVLDDVYRILKPGGELYFADIYTDRRVPGELREDPELYGECLSGALYWHDFLKIAGRAGFKDPRLVADRPVMVEDESLRARIGEIRFYAATCRLFKLPELEATSEDYGQSARYRGGEPYYPDRIDFDKHHRFEAGQTLRVSGNIARMLRGSRLARYFDVIGDAGLHAGPFVRSAEAGAASGLPFDPAAEPASGGCC